MKKKIFQSPLLLLVLIVLTFSVRLYRFSSPLADWHSWRQVDTSAVSRSFVQKGFDLLHPTFEDISNVPSGFDNPEGYRFVEFPIYNILQASGYMFFPVMTLEEWGRLISIFSSTATTVFLYLIVRRHSDSITSFFVGLFYAILPFSIYYGRVVLPDPSMIMAIMGGIYFFDCWIAVEKDSSRRQMKLWGFFLLSLLFTTSAFLLKPYALFFTLPMIVLAWNKYRYKMFINWKLWIFLILAVTPLVLWRFWLSHFPEGVPVSDWLYNGGGIRFKGAFFYWIFADRLGRLILGYWGIGIFMLGILANSHPKHITKHGAFFYSFLLASLIYVTVFARGNVQHDYYQILIIPSIAIFMGIGARALFFPPKEYVSSIVSRLMLTIAIAFTIGFGWFFVRDYFNFITSSCKSGRRKNGALFAYRS